MKSVDNRFIIHDVGAANFIPPHLVMEDAIFYHFDPDLRGIQKLEEFYKRERFKPIETHFLNFGLGSESSKKPLLLAEKNTGSKIISATSITDSTIEVEIFAANDLIAAGKIQSPNLIKIDVEGHELEVLKGYDLDDENLICVEVEVTLGTRNLGEIVAHFEQCGFELVKLVQHGDQRLSNPTKKIKKLQKMLKKFGLLMSTCGAATAGMDQLSTKLVQLELVFMKDYHQSSTFINKIKKTYGLVERNVSGRLMLIDEKTSYWEHLKFWR